MTSCATCKHFDGGTCRRYPPLATGHGNPSHPAAYTQPAVERYGVCGEWSAPAADAIEQAPPDAKPAKRKGAAA